MLSDQTKVAIIGGGPVGLTMARLLQQRDIGVSVYERDTSAEARIWGGTLDLHKDTGQKSLHKAGLLDKYYALSIPMGVKFADQNAAILATRQPSPENRYDHPEINRNVLRKMLLESLLHDTVQWGKQLVTLTAGNGKWRLTFDDHTDAVADLVIVANGGMSKARHYVTEARVEQTGSYIVQGDIADPEVNCPAFFRLCDGHRLLAAHEGNLLVVNPLNNGVLTYGLIFKKPEQWGDTPLVDFGNQAKAVAFLIEKMAGWSDLYKDLFKRTVKFVGLPTRRLSLARPWKRNRPLPVTLIGDAAHVMPPFAGMGVNIGLMDALVLSESLLEKNFTSIHDAISDYEEQMFRYAAAASQQSSANEIKMQDPAFDFRSLIR